MSRTLVIVSVTLVFWASFLVASSKAYTEPKEDLDLSDDDDHLWTNLEATKENPKYLFAGRDSKIAIILTSIYGWKITEDQDKADLLWVRRKEIDWELFESGSRQTLANKIKRSEYMTTKGHLAGGLNEWFKGKERIAVAPKAWRFYVKSECEAFFAQHDVETKPWITKATHLSRGRGIEVHGNLTKVKKKYFKNGECRSFPYGVVKEGKGEIVMDYIPNPLLLGGHKSETRAYWLVASIDPWIVLYYPGHVRVTAEKYSDDFDNIFQHIVNYDIQKHHHTMDSPEFADDRKWTLEKLKDYLVEKGMASAEWAEACMKPAQKRAIITAFNATKEKLTRRQRTFSMYGADFIIDDTLKVWLTEIQIRPALALIGIKRKFMPRMIKEMLHLVLGIQKMKKNKESLADLSPLLQKWQVLVNEGASPAFYYHQDGPDTPECTYSGEPKPGTSIKNNDQKKADEL